MSTAYPNYVDQPGLLAAMAAAGLSPHFIGTALYVADLAAAQSLVSSYNPLPAIQAQALATVATTLTARISAGFTYNGVLVACDEASQGKIDRVANMAENIIAGRSAVTWTSRTWPPFALGNPGVPLATAQDMVTFGTAIGDYMADNEFHAADLTAQIMASTATAASIGALDLDNSKGTWPTS